MQLLASPVARLELLETGTFEVYMEPRATIYLRGQVDAIANDEAGLRVTTRHRG